MIRSARSFLMAVLACATLNACSSQQGAAPGQAESYQFSPAAAGDSVGEVVARTATSLVGSPYRYGGSAPDGFDCSGLVLYSYRAEGIKVPRTSAQQFSASTPVGIDKARPGDLLFFRYGGKISHVGIYLGNQRFVHAPSSGEQVSVTSGLPRVL